MYLKKLDIQGFKSFADKVSLDFKQGITAIIGPNGSGKSNISDAVRLVLGEQSIKSLRGTRLEDVIFAGSEKRKPLGFCEINLTLDNSDYVFPFDFSEVVITRKIFRSGESEFYINKTSCRLKDIYELFLDTGIGRDGYSIIGQGKIDEILSAKPEDRRQIFEEASGISKYRYKKEEAEKKLISVNDNISRLKDIIFEIENQLNPLMIQKEKAEKYLAISKEKKELDISLYVKRIKKLTEEYDKNFVELKKFEDIQKHKKDQIDKEEIFINNQENEINKEKSKLDLKKEEFFKKSNEIEIYNGKLQLIDEKLKNNLNTIKLYKEEVKKVENKINILVEELKKAKQNVYQISNEKNNATKKLALLVEKYESIQKSEFTRKLQVEQAKEDIVEILNNLAEIKGKINFYNSLKEEALLRQKNINERIEKLNTEIDMLEQKSSSIYNQIEEINDQLKKISKLKSEEEKNYNLLAKEKENLVLGLDNKKRIYNEKKSRLYALEEMDKNYEGYNSSVKNLLKYTKDNKSVQDNIIGIVGELIKVDNIYATAIEIALGSSIQNIVVKFSSGVQKLIDILKVNNLGRITFLPLDSIKSKKIFDPKMLKVNGIIGLASDLIYYDEKLENIFTFLLGRVIVVDTLNNANEIARKFEYQYKIVTLEGEIINIGGPITGGSLKSKSSNILRRKDEILHLKTEIKNLEKEISEISDMIIKTEKKLSKSLNEIENLDSSISNMNLNKDKSILDIQRIAEDKHKLKEQIEGFRFENSQIHDNIQNYEKEINDKYREQDSLQKQKVDIENIIAEFKEDQEVESNTSKALEKDITDLKVFIAKSEEKLENEILILKEKQKSIKGEKNYISIKEETIKELIIEKDNLEKDKNEKNYYINNIKKEIKDLESEIKFLESEILKKENLFSDYKINFSIKQKNFVKEQQKYNNLELNIQKIQIELENLKNRLWEEFELTFNNAQKYMIDENIDYLKEKSSQLGNVLKDLGNVNLEAIREYKEVKERYDFLKIQLEDVLKAKDSLIMMINDTNKIIKSKFKDSFELIHIQFKETFKRLFGGGNAQLVLTNENDILNTGVDIHVQPPGKKLQNLTLLSGGEKALVAISLLFAMILIRPTPFCILDEIDAALDDANVDRFAQYLKELSKNTQFIVVTHRKGTMMVSDIIYGVTMQEKGVSKLLSIILNKDKAMKGLIDDV
ncbi:MAG: chromosome segregation protein SMC [Thermoanaerobacteraceae bacterium]